MGEIVELKPAALEDNHEFVADCCRYQEGILTEAAVKKKYHYSDDVWESLGSNEKLLEAVEEEKIRRIRTGQQKREKAQLLVTKAPDVVAGIMLDANANPRHRIDASKALDAFAATGPEGVPAGDRFQITINLGADTLKFDRSIAINANDVDPNDIVTAPASKPVKLINYEPLVQPTGRPVEKDELWAAEQAALDSLMQMGE